jgi:hypothetical protein
MHRPAPAPVLRATKRARRSITPALRDLDGVATRRELEERGFSATQIAAQLAANTWHRVGPAIVLHNATPTLKQLHRICLLNCGPRSLLTSFTALERIGLRGWARAEVHVLAPGGVPRPAVPGLRLHRVGTWSRVRSEGAHLHQRADALVLAASSFARPRAAVGIIASAVQQRLVQCQRVREALMRAPRTRHRAALLRAVVDIGQGAEALSEIDFVRLCTRYALPRPTHQATRVIRGKRRYLDVEWRLSDGRVVAVEVDGAHHMSAVDWCSDQLRQNEIVSMGTIVLRFPAVVVREEPWLVAEQLRRVLR